MNRTEGFPVDLIYATQAPTIRRLGSVRALLPRPDILVTESRWDLFLPEGLDYGRPATNMDILSADNRVSGDEMRAALGGLAEQSASPNVIGPLHITVPATGVHYAFRKLYANQGEVEAFASIPYTTASGTALGQLVSLLATGFIWFGGWLFVTKSEKLHQRGQIAVIAGGTVLLVLAVGVYHVSAAPSLFASLIAAGVVAMPRARRALDKFRESRTLEQNG